MINKNKITLNERQLSNVIYKCVKDYITEMLNTRNRGVDNHMTIYEPEGVGGEYDNNGVIQNNLMGVDGRTYMANDKGEIKLQRVSILKYKLFTYLYNHFDELLVDKTIQQALNNNKKRELIKYCTKYCNQIVKKLDEKFDKNDIDRLLNSDKTLYQLCEILTKNCLKDTILWYINDIMKLNSARENYLELKQSYQGVNEKDRLNYYKLKLPGTNIDVISLFNFSNFAGTEVIKANRISMASDEMSKLYNRPKKGFLPTTFKGTENNRSPFDFDFQDTEFTNSLRDKTNANYGSAQHFIHDVMVHGVNVLKKINYVPNFLICVPSSSNFNENFINKFSKQLGGCKSYKAFMIKNWLGYSLSEEDKQKIRQHLSYIKNMSGEDKWNDTVNVMEYTIKKGITNTFLYMISKNIKANLDVNKYNSTELTNILQYIFYQILQRENGEKLSQFLTGVTPNINRIKTKAKEILKTINKQHRGIFEYILSKIDKKYILHNNSKLEKQYGNIINKIIMDSESTLLQHLPNEQNKSNPIQINLNQITYKDTDVQMTSLFWGGVMSDGSYRDDKKVTSQLPGKELRPLMVSVYLVNKKEYVLTKEGEELINDLKTYQDIPLNETEKVEITNRKMMIFDDDMDTGASLKLCVKTLTQILNENNITNTSLKCLTMFNHIEFK